jgi:flagellar biogenesis protein FliO
MRALRLPTIISSAILWFTFPAQTLAADTSPPLKLGKPSGSESPHINSSGIILQTFIALIFTVFVIWAIYRGLKFWNSKGGGKAKQSSAVEVLSRTEVDRDMTVCVLRLGNTVSVVSRTSQGSTLLKEMSLFEAEAAGLTTSVNDSNQNVVHFIKELKERRRNKASEPVQIDQLLEDTQPLHVDELIEQRVFNIDDILEGEDK